jgi:hypothetical protein
MGAVARMRGRRNVVLSFCTYSHFALIAGDGTRGPTKLDREPARDPSGPRERFSIKNMEFSLLLI